VPGSIHSPLSRGCHLLIKQGAKLVESAQDVLEELGLPGTAAESDGAAAVTEASGQALLAVLGFDPCDIDTLSAHSGLSSEVVSSLLTQLEIDGRVAALPGGKYQRVR
jgi:DNA processing protein